MIKDNLAWKPEGIYLGLLFYKPVFYTNDSMKGVIFDLDGVLVDSMPMHYEAWKIAFGEAVNIDVDERTIYLLEGMRGIELVKNILVRTGLKEFDESMVTQTAKRKDHAVGFGKEIVRMFEARMFEVRMFDVILTADEVTKGKPDLSSLPSAVEKLKVKKTGSIVVENAPLGVEAANRAGIPCIVVLNNTPLGAVDFKPLVSEERILKRIELAFNFLQEWCNE
jgi:beta-phosphoglucomutase